MPPSVRQPPRRRRGLRRHVVYLLDESEFPVPLAEAYVFGFQMKAIATTDSDATLSAGNVIFKSLFSHL